MPLEVSEIGISMRVTGERDDTSGRRDPFNDPQEAAQEQREELIEECVRRVLAALKAERER